MTASSLAAVIAPQPGSSSSAGAVSAVRQPLHVRAEHVTRPGPEPGIRHHAHAAVSAEQHVTYEERAVLRDPS